MGRKYILAAVLSILASKATADPIFMSSHRKIDDVSATPFLESQGFINSFDAKLLKQESAPKSIFLFNVNVNDKNSAAAIDELSNYAAIQKQFKPSENTYSTPYVKEASTKDFNRKLLNTIGDKNYIVSEVPLKDFSFENVNELSKSGNKVLSVSHINTKDLPKLNNLLSNYQNTHAKNIEHDHVIVLKFTEDSANAVQNLVDTRILAGDTPVKQTVGITDKTAQPIGIRGGAFAGIIIVIFLTIFLYIAFGVMQEIKTPAKFYKETLQIGKEH